MTEFFSAVGHYGFLQAALMTGILASISCGIVGTWVVTRRITYVAGAIAHFVLGGMGAARYFQAVHGWHWFDPLYGAIGSSLVAAVIIGLVTLYAKEREDTVIGAIWAIGMAAGILFISKTPGYNQDLMSYLFGNILMVTPGDLWLIAALDAVVVLISILFYSQILAVCFDEEYAGLRGIPAKLFYVLILCITALTVVILVTVVGIVMVIALLTIPAAIAGQFSSSMRRMMVLAVGFCLLFTTGGLALSYGPDLPTGATIIVLCGLAYVVVLVGRKIFI